MITNLIVHLATRKSRRARIEAERRADAAEAALRTDLESRRR